MAKILRKTRSNEALHLQQSKMEDLLQDEARRLQQYALEQSTEGQGGYLTRQSTDGSDPLAPLAGPNDFFRYRLDSGAGNDFLNGGLGADVLRGGTGSDRMAGGGGRDRFEWDSRDLSRSTDVITDFSVKEDVLSFKLFDQSLSQAQRLALLEVVYNGHDSVLHIRAHHGQIVQTLVLKDVNLLSDKKLGQLTSEQALIKLANRGSLELLDDLIAPALTASTIAKESHRISMLGTEGDDALKPTQRQFKTAPYDLDGRGGDDKLRGAAGEDCLTGGAGNDVMTGYAGRDTFYFTSKDLGGYIDTITDFNPRQDVLHLNVFKGVTEATRFEHLVLSFDLESKVSTFELHNDQGQRVQTIKVLGTNLLLDDNGVVQSSEDAIQRLWLTGRLILSEDHEYHAVQIADQQHPDLQATEESDILVGSAGRNTFSWDAEARGTDTVRGFVWGEDQLRVATSLLENGEYSTRLEVRAQTDNPQNHQVCTIDQGSGQILQTVILENTAGLMLDASGATLSNAEVLSRLLEPQFI